MKPSKPLEEFIKMLSSKRQQEIYDLVKDPEFGTSHPLSFLNDDEFSEYIGKKAQEDLDWDDQLYFINDPDDDPEIYAFSEMLIEEEERKKLLMRSEEKQKEDQEIGEQFSYVYINSRLLY